ncbi:hypothetical protein H8E88_13235 [candidate division KSB1 bacterium]|nr:hypothetical protein [candidate division KSB1 bacterium]MBL7094551.1 hypothetical protein [candidate division KSB1 bacterium]
MKVFLTILVCLCVFLLFSSVLIQTNLKSENLINYNFFAEANGGGDNGDPLPLPPNPPPPPPPGFV